MPLENAAFVRTGVPEERIAASGFLQFETVISGSPILVPYLV